MSQLLTRLLRPALALALALLFLQGGDVSGQGRKSKGEPPATKEDAVASPELEAWIKTLTEKMTDRQDSIRDSARAGLVSVGRPALPTLKKLVESKDSATAEAAKQVIARIDGGSRGPGSFGGRFGGGPGGPGGGPGFPGLPGGRGSDQPRGPGFRGGDQPRPSGLPGFGANEQLFKDLKLSDKQKSKVDEIVAEQQKKWKEMQAKKFEGNELRDAIAKAREGFLKELKGVLTQEQYEKYVKGSSEAPRGPGSRSGRIVD